MKPKRTIPRNWRLIFTSLALLLVLSVNHRALPAYAYGVAKTDQAAVQTPGQDADSSVLKQKVSLEAVSSFTQEALAQPAAFSPLAYLAPLPRQPQPAVFVPYWTFLLQQLATQPLSPNAP